MKTASNNQRSTQIHQPPVVPFPTTSHQPPMASRPSNVEEQLCLIIETVNNLGNEINELGNRIAPILRQELENEECSNRTREALSTPLAVRLQDVHQQLTQMRSYVQTTIARVEV